MIFSKLFHKKISKQKNAALVCSGGGALGVGFLGPLEVLEKKYEFDFYAGVSAGAIVTAMHANGMKSEQIWELIQKTKLFSLAFDFAKSNFGILQGKKIHALLNEIFEGKCIEDLERPLYIGTTNFQTGEKVFLHRGRIADAIRASISVPVFFEPYFHPTEKKWLVDGGLTENLPLSIAIRKYKGQKIIALDTTHIDPTVDFQQKTLFQKTKTLRKTINRTIKIFFQNQQREFVRDPRVTHIDLAFPNLDSLDVFKLDKIYERGQQIAKEKTIEL